MRHIGIITKCIDPRAIAATREVAEWLHLRGIQVSVVYQIAVDAGIAPEVAHRCDQEEIADGPDMVIVIGGDGTFIAAARAIGRRDIPLLGVNMGRLGFLTEVPGNAIFATLEEVLAGRFTTERRMTLCAAVERDGTVVLQHRVLNDVVIHKGELARMMEFDVAMDGQFVFSSRADGLIVATPTGSTAYALSAGGPILHPAIDAILLAPICPHTLTHRPIAVPGDGTIAVTPKHDGVRHLLTLDGQTGFPLEKGDRIVVRQSDAPLRILHSPDRNYYDLLRNKLRWGEGVGS